MYQFLNGDSQYSLSYFEKLVRALAAMKCGVVLKGAAMIPL